MIIISIAFKANIFIDRRFGEHDERMSLEDKMMKRFTMEKKVCTDVFFFFFFCGKSMLQRAHFDIVNIVHTKHIVVLVYMA